MKGRITHAKLQYYRHNYCLVCMTGLLGCRWHRYKQSTRDSRKRDLTSFAVLVVAFLYTVFYFYFWLIIDNDSYYISLKMFHKLDTFIPWYPMVLAFSCVVFAYLTVIMALCVCHAWHGHQLYTHPVHLTLVAVLLSVCVLGTVLVTAYVPREWRLVCLSMQVYGPFLQLIAVVSMTLLFWLLCRQWFKLQRYVFKCVWFLVFVTFMAGLYLSPLAIDSPLVRSSTPPKPELVALGGAVQVAPENTMLAFEKAVEMGVNKFHTTVQISSDGVPFLFGGSTLEHMTNATGDNSTLNPMEQTWEGLSSLDSGSWWIQADPFGSSSSLSPSALHTISQQRLLSLQTFLSYLETLPQAQVFLAYTPLPPQHSNYTLPDTPATHIIDGGAGRVINDVLMGSLSKNLSLQVHMFATPVTSDRLEGTEGILTRPLTPSWADQVEQVDVVLLGLADLTLEGIREIQRANLSVGVQEVNTGWLASLLWCAGVDLLLTHDIQRLMEMEEPIWRMSENNYLALWICVDIVSAVLILLMFIAQRVSLYGSHFSPEAISLSSGKACPSYKSRTMKEQLLRGGGTMESQDDLTDPPHPGDSSDGVYSMSFTSSVRPALSLTSLSAIRVEQVRGQQTSIPALPS